MAKVKRNIMLSGLSGSLGPDHYARVTRDGKTIISQNPDFSNQQFGEAHSFLKNQAFVRGTRTDTCAGTQLFRYFTEKTVVSVHRFSN